MHWSSNAPDWVCHQINNCTKKGRHVTGLCFRGNWWYVSGEKPDGTGSYCWGNIPEKSCNAKAAIGTYDYNFDEHSYAVCHEHGGYNSCRLPAALLDTMHKAKTIQNIFLSDDEQYFIRFDNSWSWNFSNKYLQKELKSTKDSSVCSASIFNDGTWLVFRKNSFRISTGISDDLESLIEKHYDDQKKIIENQSGRTASYLRAIASVAQG